MVTSAGNLGLLADAEDLSYMPTRNFFPSQLRDQLRRRACHLSAKVINHFCGASIIPFPTFAPANQHMNGASPGYKTTAKVHR